MLNTDRLCLGCMKDNGNEKICQICGYDSSAQNDVDFLPTKFWIRDRFLVGKVVASNGEGVTYIGWDNSTDNAVQIREYFPTGIAKRNPDKTVTILDEEKKFAFNEGLMNFIELHEKLMGLDLPSLIPTVAVFEENGTAYSVTANFSGITLQDFLIRNGGSLKWEQGKPLFLPLVDSIIALNRQGIVHGGISPETILVGRDGKLRLDGICIRGTRSAASNMTAQIYPGYAALEQYETATDNMGSYTDVYSISAVLFRVFIGVAPPDAVERVERDALSVPAHFAEELPHSLLAALANGLQVASSARTASLEEFKQQLVNNDINIKYTTQNSSQKEQAALSAPEKKKASGAKYAVISAAVTAVAFLLIAAVLAVTVFRDDFFPSTSETESEVEEYEPSPSMPTIGEYDSDAAESIVTYKVPDFSGKYYSQIIDNEEYEAFKFSIKAKEYSTNRAKGMICAQTVEAGSEVARDTVIELTISLGPKEFKIANVVGMDETEAKLELLKQGFLYENIEVEEMYDSEKASGAVLKQEPEYGATVNSEMAVRIFINSYKGEESSDEVQNSGSNKKN